MESLGSLSTVVLHSALEDGCEKAAEVLVRRVDNDVNAKDPLHHTLLSKAIKRGYETVVPFPMDRGAGVNARGSWWRDGAILSSRGWAHGGSAETS